MSDTKNQELTDAELDLAVGAAIYMKVEGVKGVTGAQRPYDPSAGSVGFRPYDPSAGSVGF